MLNRDFKEFAELLDAKGVEYLLVGGYALAAMVALSMSSATARLSLKRRSGVLGMFSLGSSSQLRLSVLATVPVRMIFFSS
jgi:hypothetical protein